MSLLESVPPGAIPFLSAVVAGVIGYLLWRVFKLAMKVVALVAFVIVMAGVFAWWQPELFGLGKDIVQDTVLPGIDNATRDLQEKARDAATEAVKDAVRDAVGPAPAPKPTAPKPTASTSSAPGSP